MHDAKELAMTTITIQLLQSFVSYISTYLLQLTDETRLALYLRFNLIIEVYTVIKIVSAYQFYTIA